MQNPKDIVELRKVDSIRKMVPFKYIFLDFDGVLNNYSTEFDPNAIANLRTLIDVTGAKIVVSSSWRLLGLKRMERLWKEHGLPDEIYGATPSCNAAFFTNAFSPHKKWSSLPSCRGIEIEEWLRNCAPEFHSYAILDDDDSEILVSQQNHLVKTDPMVGLTEENVRQTIAILGKI